MSSKSLKSFFQVELGVVTLNKTARQNLTRHKARFGITSFIYRSRKPFHPDRFGQQFVEPFFSKMNLLEGHERVEDVEGEEEKREEEEKLEDEKDKVLREELQVHNLQEEAGLKQARRTDMIGQLLRSKGDLLNTVDLQVNGFLQYLSGNVSYIHIHNSLQALSGLPTATTRSEVGNKRATCSASSPRVPGCAM